MGFPLEAIAADLAGDFSEAWFKGTVGPFVKINRDNSIEIGYPNPEMGQGVSVSLPMIVAEELDANWDQISVSQMPLELRKGPGGRPTWAYVGQGAGGSDSVTEHWPHMRQAGAAARLLVLKAAEKRTGIARSRLRTEKGYVLTPGGDRIAYGELASLAARQKVEDAEVTLKQSGAFKLIGTPRPMKDNRAIVTGAPLFGLDAVYPGMLHAVVERCPWFDGSVRRVNSSRALAVPGVRHVVPIEGPGRDGDYIVLAAGVAVVAETLWAAMKGRQALKVEWDRGPHEQETTDRFRQSCQDLLSGSGQVVRSDGNFALAYRKAARTFEARYWEPYVAHAQLEPQNCIAHVFGNHCNVLGPVQMPRGAAQTVTRITGIPELNVNVQMPRLGGGFGRRLRNYHVAEAVIISRAIRAPVKVTWTREDDIRHDMYRPSGLHHLQAGFDEGGRMVAWAHRLASATKLYRREGVNTEDYWKSELYTDDFPANLVPNLKLEYFPASSGVPRDSWRAPGHNVNAFVVQSFIDEIAHGLGEDALALRLRLLGPARSLPYKEYGGPRFDTGRLAEVLRVAARHGDWGRKLSPGRGRGIAAHFTFGSYAANVIDVEVSPQGELKILKVVNAVDCGLCVNPNGVAMQMEGGINDGLSTALGQAVTIAGGRVAQGNFDTYKMMRIGQAPPEVEVHLVNSGFDPSGIGEIGLPPVAPALASAIFNATGRRIRDLPIGEQLAGA